MDIIQILIVTVAASIVWFIAGAILWMNPVVSKIYSSFERDKGMRGGSDPKWMPSLFVIGGLIPIFFYSLVYVYIMPVLPVDLLGKTLAFGSIISLISVLPNYFDKELMTAYPHRLSIIEAIFGIILSFVITLIFGLMF